MKHQFNHRNYRNNFMRNVGKSMTVSMIAMSIALTNFGIKAVGFLANLVTIGSGPFEGLNRRQLKDMYWLRYMYPC
jgi:hypothetical protein